jgi:hypothetical protein
MKTIVDVTLPYRKALSRILEYEEKHPRCYFNDPDPNMQAQPLSKQSAVFQAAVNRRMAGYMAHKKKLYDLKQRKKALFPNEQAMTKTLREQANERAIQSKGLFNRLRYAMNDYEEFVKKGTATEESLHALELEISTLTSQYHKAQLELRIAQSVFRDFKRFQVVDSLELEQVTKKRNNASAVYNDARAAFDPWKRHKQVLYKEGYKLNDQEESDFSLLQKRFAVSSRDKHFWAWQLERVEVRTMKPLLDKLEIQHKTKKGSTEEKQNAVLQQCKALTDAARDVQTERLREEQEATNARKAQEVSLALASTSASSHAGENLKLLNIQTEYDATSAAYLTSFTAQGFILDDMAESDGEETNDRFIQDWEKEAEDQSEEQTYQQP